jgi:hypothetical protein
MKDLKSGAALLGTLALAMTQAACSHVKPWERGRLAHPTMVTDPGGPAEDHVNAIHEGAAGGATSAQSGCGCN